MTQEQGLEQLHLAPTASRDSIGPLKDELPVRSPDFSKILAYQEERTYLVISASADKKHAISLGKFLVCKSEDGITLTRTEPDSKHHICGHLGAVASFVCFFSRPNESHPTIIHAEISKVQESGEFDVQLGELSRDNDQRKTISKPASWLLFRIQDMK